MSETRRVRSIARKVTSAWTLRTLAVLLALNAAVAAQAFAGCACHWERSIAGEKWSIGLSRALRWEEPRSLQTLGRVEYCFQSPDGVWHAAALAPALDVALPCAAALLAIEAVLLALGGAGARRSAQRLLRPLDRMAREMQAVSRAHADSARYEDRLRELENAIERIRPTEPGERLRTGAQELTGLENALTGCSCACASHTASRHNSFPTPRTNCARPSPSFRATRTCSRAGARTTRRCSRNPSPQSNRNRTT